MEGYEDVEGTFVEPVDDADELGTEPERLGSVTTMAQEVVGKMQFSSKGDLAHAILDLVDVERHHLAIRSLKIEQRVFFDHCHKHNIKRWYESVGGPEVDQLFYFLTGGAGTGKSLLTRVVVQEVEIIKNRGEFADPNKAKVMVMSSTGKAAADVDSRTMHNIFGIPVMSHVEEAGLMPLSKNRSGCSSKKAMSLEDEFSYLGIVVIDETSMVTAPLFVKSSMRMCRAKHTSDTKKIVEDVGDGRMKERHVPRAFGDLDTIMIGDMYQLYPIGPGVIDRP